METYDSLPNYQRRELQRIDKEIQEYLTYIRKLHNQRQKNLTFTHATISKKQQNRFAKFLKDKNSLPEYAQKKLAELERRKKFIISQKEYKKEISWDNIIFHDYCIQFSLDGMLSEAFPLQESRKSFEFIRHYITKSNLPPIRTTVWGNKVVSIQNIEQLQNIIEILCIQGEINLYLDDFERTTIEKIFSKLKNVSNQQLFDSFKLRERGPYLNYLCQIQSSDYKLIPTTEIVKVNPKTDTIEDTFLFTSVKKDRIYVVWESTSINRATYIFKITPDSYTRDVQKVFDFIASSQPKKRRKLRYMINKGRNPLHTVGVVEHDGLKQWKTKIQTIFSK